MGEAFAALFAIAGWVALALILTGGAWAGVGRVTGGKEFAGEGSGQSAAGHGTHIEGPRTGRGAL